jgi:DTW domain-containing protein YfiP
MTADRDPTPCPACRLHQWLCVCGFAPRVATRAALLLVVHVHELGRTSNTARLLTLAVRDAVLVGHGGREAPVDLASHVPAGATPVVLFPGRGARPLTPELVAALPSPLALVVPDGNWRQAARMVKRLPLLDGAAKVALPARHSTGRPLRRNRPGRMSTYEAVAQALGVLEGEAVAGPLLDFYRRATDRTLFIRGKLKADDVYGGLAPPEPGTSGGVSKRSRSARSRVQWPRCWMDCGRQAGVWRSLTRTAVAPEDATDARAGDRTGRAECRG